MFSLEGAFDCAVWNVYGTSPRDSHVFSVIIQADPNKMLDYSLISHNKLI